MYRERYLRKCYFEALELIKPLAVSSAAKFTLLYSILMGCSFRQDKHGLRLTEVALRWCQHHSVLTPNDGVILGASSVSQLQQNMADRHAGFLISAVIFIYLFISAKGPLPEDIVTALDEAWMMVKPMSPTYWR